MEAENNLYNKSLLSKQIFIPSHQIGRNIVNKIQNHIASEVEGKCIIEGYVKSNSVNIISYSNGIVTGRNIKINVTYECLICAPVEGALIQCVAKNITKAGIRAEIDEEENPVVIFVARDHHYKTEQFADVKVGEYIDVKVVGQRFELNDTHVSVIAELVKEKI